MNKLKIVFIAAVAICFISCGEKFLKEVDTTRLTTDCFNTPEGLKAAAVALPVPLRLQASCEYGIAQFQTGTDEFSTGGDTSLEHWNNYTELLAPYIAATSGLSSIDY